MEKNKRNKIIGLSIGIFIVLIIVASSTYAYWQITKTQTTQNDIVAACLDLNLEDKSAAIDLDSAWPISDDEAGNLTGYTFTVTNNCNEEINYIVGLNRVEDYNYLQDLSVKVRLDEQSSHVYGDLSDVEYADAENTYTSRVSKQISVESISANGTNEHTIRVWVSEDAPVTEQRKIFQGQVFITGGQGIEVKDCFSITNDGMILGYDESCGLDVKVPAEINGTKVKNINAASFANFDFIAISAYVDEEDVQYIGFIKNLTYEVELINELKQMICENLNECDLEEMGYIIFESLEEFNNYDWSKYSSIVVEGGYIYDEVNETIILDMGDANNGHHIKSLDLSETIYLETIGYGALEGGFKSEVKENDTCEYVNNTSVDTPYYYCLSELEMLILPENGNLKIIGGYAFAENQLTNVIIPSSVEVIQWQSFNDNLINSLIFTDTINNPSQLTKIEENAFANNQLTKVVIPGSITYIGHQAFDNNNLTEVIIKKESSDGITFDGYGWFNDVTPTYNPNYTE